MTAGTSTLLARRHGSAYLCVDVGTSAVKAGLVDADGVLVASSAVEYALDSPRPGQVECAADVYWAAVVGSVRATLAQAGRAAAVDIRGIAVSSQGESLVVLDGHLRPLRPVLVWLDNRSVDEARLIEDAFGLDVIYRRTGQIASLATWTSAKLLWLARNEPQSVRDARMYLLLGDWVVHRLCGELIAEHSRNVTTLLLDVESRSWWADMLGFVGLTDDRLPPLVHSDHVAGRLTTAAAHELGVKEGTPVVAGALDQVAGALGSGNTGPGLLTEATGTVLGMAACLPSMPASRAAGIPVGLSAVPGAYLALPCCQTAGIVLRWFRDLARGQGGAAAYEDLIAEAAEIPPGADGLTFVPHLAGAQFPHHEPMARGMIAGLSLAHTRAHVTRAIMEAVAYLLRGSLDQLMRAGVLVDEIVSAGPASTSAAWRQIKADVCRRPVVAMECTEAAIMGSAVIAAVALGERADAAEAAASMVRRRSLARPDPRTAAAYDAAFERYHTFERLVLETAAYDARAPHA